jgi:hypothetical protein
MEKIRQSLFEADSHWTPNGFTVHSLDTSRDFGQLTQMAVTLFSLKPALSSVERVQDQSFSRTNRFSNSTIFIFWTYSQSYV